ncbi:hypothetical protein [Nonomuraea aurantiaca]|uniref:hypothetical protein n=1 Tax=Nonomuraea aurantiaca TaxID=2878562 RepID=UPI001CD93C78|nr:hypothetical protein [Nonomuraea aurantiaca]MCA2227532.1 hypothetical protein [Nonomuraea aurantiaca]
MRRRLQAGHDVRHRCQPVGGQFVGEGGAVDVALAVAEGMTVVLVGNAVTGAVGLRHPGQDAAYPGEHVGQRRHMRGVVDVCQHTRVRGVQAVAPLPVGGLGQVDREELKGADGAVQQAFDELIGTGFRAGAGVDVQGVHGRLFLLNDVMAETSPARRPAGMRDDTYAKTHFGVWLPVGDRRVLRASRRRPALCPSDPSTWIGPHLVGGSKSMATPVCQ